MAFIQSSVSLGFNLGNLMNYKVTVTYKAIFQATKCKVRGYVRSETMPRVLFLIAGKINFSRFNEHAR